MNFEPKYVNSLRLKTFLDLLAREFSEEQIKEALAELTLEQKVFFDDIDQYSWLSGDEEGAIAVTLCKHFDNWDAWKGAGRECVHGILANLISSLPELKLLKDYLAWLPSLISIFNVGIFPEYREAKNSKSFVIQYDYQEGRNPQISDILFIQGILAGLMEFLNVGEADVHLRCIPFSQEEWPIKGEPIWLAYNQSRIILEGTVKDLNMVIADYGPQETDLDWKSSSRDIFIRQVIERSTQLFTDKRELTTAVEYLNMANEKLEKQIRANEKELRLAGNIQKGFFPPSLPDWQGLRCWVNLQPLMKVSGDIYDYFNLPGDRLGLMVCDVSGHGVPAALISAIAKISFQNHKHNSPAEIFNNVNQDLIKYVRMEGYITAFFMVIEKDFKVQYSIAAQPAPFLYRRKTGEIETLQCDGTLLGMFPDAQSFFANRELQLEPGDKLFIFTDGLTEGLNRNDSQFGEQRIRDCILATADKDITESCEYIMKGYREFILGNDPQDDLTLVGLEVSERLGEFQNIVTEARAANKSKEYAKACELMETALEIFPRNPDGLYRLGKFQAYGGKYQEALDTLRIYKQLMPYDPNSYNIQAYCLYHLGNLEQAERDLLKSLRLRVRNPSAIYNLATLYKKQGRLEEAKEMKEALRDLSSDNEAIQKVINSFKGP